MKRNACKSKSTRQLKQGPKSRLLRLESLESRELLDGTGDNGADTDAGLSPTVVTTTADVVADDGYISLREAIANAGTGNNPTTVTFESTVFGSGDKEIKLDSGLGQLTIDHTVTINADNGPKVTVSGENQTRIFNIIGGTVTAYKLTLKNGYAEDGGAVSVGTDNWGTNDAFVAYNCCFEGNKAFFEANQGVPTGYGGAVFIHTGGKFESYGSTFNGNEAVEGGGAVCVEKGVFNSENDSFIGNSATDYVNGSDGGAVAVLPNGAFTAKGGTFVSNSAEEGGAVFCGGTTTISDTKFEWNHTPMFSNTDTGGGGAITSNASLVTSNCIFSNNGKTKSVVNGVETVITDTESGGAIEIESGTYTSEDDVFSDNAAQGDGGAIYVPGDNSFVVKKATFEYNKADEGGAIYAAASAAGNAAGLIFEGCAFENNEAAYVGLAGAGDGGAIYSDSKITLKDYVDESADETVVVHTSFSRNYAGRDGGAVYVNAGTLAVENATFTSNKAGMYGGAVCVTEPVADSFNATNVVFQSNEAARGGAIWNKGTVEINGASEFKNNVAKTKGTESAAPSNGSFGGAIYNAGNGKVTITGTSTANPDTGVTTFSVVFNGNQATGEGTLAVHNGAIKGYSGGAIYNSGSGEVSVTNAAFADNFAGKYGGAISNFATLTVKNAAFTSNVASAGGAVQNAGSAAFEVATFDGNLALMSNRGLMKDVSVGPYYEPQNSSSSRPDYGPDYGGNGGAIFTSNKTVTTTNGVTNGGGSTTFKGKTTFINNKAVNAGGAIDYISGSLTFYGDGSSEPNVVITGNVAGTIGGAMVVAGSVAFKDNPDFDIDNNVGSVALSSYNAAFFADPAEHTAGFYAPNVAATYGDDGALSNMKNGFFEGNVTPKQFDTFTRYVTTAPNNIVTLGDLAESFAQWKTIHVSVDSAAWVDYTSSVDSNTAVVSFSYGNHKIRYYADDNTDVVFCLNISVFWGERSVRVTTTQFDLAGRTYIDGNNPNNPLAVGVSIQIHAYENTPEPVCKWKLNWGDGKIDEISNYGFTCNAYHIYKNRNAAPYSLTLETYDATDVPLGYYSFVNIAGEIFSDGNGAGSGAELDSELDVFADPELVDELFDF